MANVCINCGPGDLNKLAPKKKASKKKAAPKKKAKN